MTCGTLYIVATPIGNLEDITHRALRVLSEVDVIAAEDTRHTRKLLTHYEISQQLVSCHRHNEAQRSAELVQRLSQGHDVALVSDAGTPGIADPGARLVEQAVAAGVTVVPIPGPCAMAAMLSVAGRMGVPVTFLGFLPEKKGKRRRALEHVCASDGAMVCYVARWDVAKYLAECADVFGPERKACLGRELTKRYEEISRGTLADLAQSAAEQERKGEFVLMIAGAKL